MATLYLPRTQQHLLNQAEVEDFLYQRNIPCGQWQAAIPLPPSPTPEIVLNAYAAELTPFMKARGYQTADVIHIDGETPNLADLQAKFFKEHTHSEDEVRFFVQGQGDFWFHLHDDANDGVFCVRATAGDLLAVPAGIAHWFDFGYVNTDSPPNVTVIRLFTDAKGWEPHYTGSDLAQTISWAAPICNAI
jgi:1,2-dihydroxy-3-keto-5-methylthiopentene dioxygenase